MAKLVSLKKKAQEKDFGKWLSVMDFLLRPVQVTPFGIYTTKMYCHFQIGNSGNSASHKKKHGKSFRSILLHGMLLLIV